MILVFTHHSTVICREKAQGDSFRCLPCKSKTLHGSKGPFTSPGVKNTRLSHMPTPVLVRTHNRLHLLLPSLHHLQQLRHVKHGSALIPRQDFRPRRVRNARTLPKLTLPVSWDRTVNQTTCKGGSCLMQPKELNPGAESPGSLTTVLQKHLA